MKRIGIVAGEASGDMLGAKLIQAIKQQFPDVYIDGLGGPAMMAQGFTSLHDMERLSVMGLIEPLKRLPDLFKLRRDLYHHFIKTKPGVFIGIDSPDFNLGLELKLKKIGIPIIHYVSPSVWAWRKYRIKKISKAVNLMLTLLPFEADFYQQHGVPVMYAGHPLAEQIPLLIDKMAAKKALNLATENTYIALLPGSRQQELAQMAIPFLQAAKLLHKNHPNICFLIPCANQRRLLQWQAYCQPFAADLPLLTFLGQASDILAAADFAVVTSGTATLECMLYKTPMVICYRMSPLAYKIAKYLVKIPFIGLPNLLAKKLLVPELIQDEMTPEMIAQHLNEFLVNSTKNEATRQAFTQLHTALRVSSQDVLVQALLEVTKQE